MTASPDTLRQSPLFAELSDDALRALAATGATVELDDGELLMAEGGEADAMYVVTSGALTATKQVGEGQVAVGAVGPGELVGELALVHGRPRSATLHAVGRTTLWRIGAEALDDVLAQPGAGRAVLAAATRRLETQDLLLRSHTRMATLGTLTAGLLHELNNPAAAVRRAADQLAGAQATMNAAEAVMATADAGLRQRLAALASRVADTSAARELDPLARGDAEEALRATLARHGVERPWNVAGALVDAGLAGADVDALLDGADATVAQATLTWLAARVRAALLLGEVAAASERLSEVVAAVKSYSHHDEAPVQDVDVHAGLDAALTLLRHKIPAEVRVDRHDAPDLPTVEGHPGDLNGVWTNLLDNALDAVGETGKVEITTAADAADADWVTVTIADDGPGIPDDVIDRIFDPFFTTKPVGAGTGLGLAMAHAVITQRHGGRLDVDSRPGRTAFTVALPRARRAEPTAGPDADG